METYILIWNQETAEKAREIIQKGELVAFVGPNGAGKSTTIKMLTGIIHPTSGEIKVCIVTNKTYPQ